MENNLEFIIKSAVLVHYCGPGGDVVIPKGVWEIGWAAFANCRSLTSVVIPEGVTEIGGNAFDGCTNLTNVTIPESVNEIEEINQFDDDMEYSENLIIRAPAGSYAEQHAAEHGIPLEPVPDQLRACLISQRVRIGEIDFLPCKAKSRRNPDGLQGFLTQSGRKICRQGGRGEMLNRLLDAGLDRVFAFNVMEEVRKGNGVDEECASILIQSGIPEWFINSCNKISYLFPKGHCASIITIPALKAAWYKTRFPKEYTQAYSEVCGD